MHTKAIGTGLLLAALAATGCSKDDSSKTDSTPQAQQKTDATGQAEHGPHGVGPNGGVVFDLGRHHAEFTVDHPKKECMILILGDDEQTATPIAATELTLMTKATRTADGTAVPPMTIKMLPQDAKDGKATVFVGSDPGIGHVADFEGTVLGMIDGKPSQGEFSEADGAAGHSHDHTHGHAHGEDDALVWVGEPREHAGTTIQLGHHGRHLHAGQKVEPAVSITRDGEPVSDAKVFNSLLSADGETVLAKEVPTIFEPTTEEEPAHYAQGALAIPEDVTNVVIRFRIVLPGGEPQTFDVPVKVE